MGSDKSSVEKLQVVNGYWTYFYNTSMYTTDSMPRGDKPVSRTQAWKLHATEIAKFRFQCQERSKYVIKPYERPTSDNS